jgi:hypothetical protein
MNDTKFKAGFDPRRNTKGRPRGKTNVAAEQIREWITDFLKAKWQDLYASFDQLKPREKWDIALRLMAHKLPAPTLTEADYDIIIERLKKEEMEN